LVEEESIMRRSLLVTAAAIAAAVSIAACGSSASSGSGGSGQQGGSTPYRVMVTGGLSAEGVLATNSETSVLATKAGAKVINARGGIDGHKVVVTVSDDAGTASTAVTNLLNAIHSGNKPDLYLNSGPSTVAAAVLPILKANGILSFNIGPTSNSATAFPLNFDLSPGPADYIKGFIPTMKTDGYKKIGIIHGSDAYGTFLGQQFQSLFTAAGFTVTSNQEYSETALSMTAQLQAIEATKPDVLVMDAYGAPVGYVLKSLQLLGWNIPILADNSVSATSVVSTPAPSGLEGTALVKNLKMQVFKSTVYTKSDTLVNTAVSAMTGLGKIDANMILAYNYDAFPLVAAAAAAAHSIAPTAIAAELVKPSVLASAHTAVLSLYNFTAADHAPQADDNEFTFVSPSVVVAGQFGH
jgi:branched-chain amino acid transport system substrate-binding protein